MEIFSRNNDAIKQHHSLERGMVGGGRNSNGPPKLNNDIQLVLLHVIRTEKEHMGKIDC
jgi:hypothetical protein